MKVDLSGLSEPQVKVVKRTKGNTLVLAGAGSGKGQNLDSLVLTPQGYVKMRDVTLGQEVIDALGNLTTVAGIFPQGERECFKITLDDNTCFTVDDQHINRIFWKKKSKKNHCDITTMELIKLFDTEKDIRIPMVDLPLGHNNTELKIDPYLLGALLGDGGLSKTSIYFANAEQDVLDKVTNIVSRYGYTMAHSDRYNYAITCVDKQHLLHHALRQYNLMGKRAWEKHIPKEYLLASREDRIALLQGLMDTDGWVETFISKGKYQCCDTYFGTTSPQLSEDIEFLVRSLGVRDKVTLKTKYFSYKGEKKQGRPFFSHRLKAKTEFPLCTSEKHLSRIKPRMHDPFRRIVSIESIGFQPCQCIKVASEDETYITDFMIPTHNTHAVTHKIAYLLDEGVVSDSILAVTFTNKAAKEMQNRVYSMVDIEKAEGLNIQTFHSFCMRMLTKHGRAIGLENFRVMDMSERLKLVKELISSYGKDITEKASAIAGIISTYKNSMISEWTDWKSLKQDEAKLYKVVNEIFPRYCSHCNALTPTLLDFDDILLRAFDLLEQSDEVRNYYRTKIQHFLIDEYQDQNLVQEKITELIVLENKDISFTCVGDDDQSIYGFRNAILDYIMNFTDKYSAEQIKLEENYRCPANIVRLGADILKPNTYRLEKNVFSKKVSNTDVQVVKCTNGYSEAHFVAKEIDMLRSAGISLGSIVVLFRTNAQSFNFEKSLMALKIPSRINKGLRFVDRREVKDTFAFLRCMFSDTDDMSFDRIANVPPRGLGDGAKNTLQGYAMTTGLSLQQAAADENNPLPKKSKSNLLDLLYIMNKRAEKMKNDKVYEYASIFIGFLREINYFSIFKEKGEREDTAIENICEIFAAYTAYYDGHAEDERLPFLNFLSELALDSSEIDDKVQEDSVVLSTVHGVKGLEYNTVFLTGFEEGKFPHFMSKASKATQEERRLAYVAVTRSSDKLYITYAQERQQAWGAGACKPSPFLDDISYDLYREKRHSTMG